MEDAILQYILSELTGRYDCHTIILYGSRAREEHTLQSEYDVVGVRSAGDHIRDARFYKECYLDLFILPESRILSPDDSLLYLHEGVVLLEKDRLGTQFLKS